MFRTLGHPVHAAPWLLAAALLVAGCKTTSPAPAQTVINGPTTAPSAVDAPVATLNGHDITRSELDDALYHAYGVNFLADLAVLDLAKQGLAEKHLALTDADIADERKRSMEKLFPTATPAEYDTDYRQLRAKEHLTETEFDLGFRTTAALRKIVHPLIGPKVTDASVEQAYNLLYGGKRRIADITVGNLIQVAQVQGELKTKPFAVVALNHSLDNRTKANGGEWPPFSDRTPGVPAVIMTTAFGMNVGDVSRDPIVDGGQYHVIKLMEIIPPKLVKFADVKDDVRKQVEDSLEEQEIKLLRKQFEQVAVQYLNITDPSLKSAWDKMVADQQPSGKTMSPKDAVDKIHASEKPSATRPTTAP